MPSSEQARTGKYFKPTVHWHGLPVSVENVPGQIRKGIGSDGKPFERKMKAAYGEIAGTRGADGDPVDIMMGPHADGDKAFVIDQLDHTGKRFDEAKIQVGVRNEAEARAQYLSHYPKDWKGLGAVTELSADQLKHWLKEGDLSKPIDPESVPREKAVRGPGPDPRHDSILGFLARHPRGLDREEAEAQGIDPADMALAAAHVGIKRAFRKGGLSFDHAAEALHEAGYPVADSQGHYSPNALLDKIDSELRGTPVYSSRNEAQLAPTGRDWRHPLSDAELAKLSVDETRARLEKLRAEQDRLERELERAGLDEPAEHESEAELDRIPFARNEDKYRENGPARQAIVDELNALREAAKSEHDATVDVNLTRGGDLDVSLVVVPRGARNQGIGTQLMELAVAIADKHGLRMVLSPAHKGEVHGTTSSGRLVGFYKRFGFVQNKGRHKDFTLSESMYRLPKEGAADLARPAFTKGMAPGVQQDLFGAVVNVKNEIKRVEAALDAKRNTGQESVETGRADDLFSQARRQEVMFRRGAGVPHRLTEDAVRSVVDRILKTFGVKPDVTVVGTLHDLDGHPEVGHIVRDAGNADAVAFVHPRTQKIYIVADQVTSAEHAATVLAHEYVTHFGLRAAFGDRRAPEYQAILEGVAKAMPSALRERGEEEFPGTYNPLNRHHRNIAAEEVLAYYGQQYAADQSVPAKIKRWLDKLKGMVRDWIRKVLGLPQKFDELFVRRTLADLESYLRRGRPSKQGSVPEGTSDGVARATESLRNAAQTEPFRSHGFGAIEVPAQRRMLHEVFTASQDSEVRRVVLSAIPVDVMNVLARQQFTAENLFHNYPVFLKLVATAAHPDVPLSMQVATAMINAVALRAAKMEGILPNVGRSLVLGSSAHEAVYDGHGPAFSTKQDTFYSAVSRAVDAAKRDKGTGAEWAATLRNMPGVRNEEMEWLGLKDWLEGRGRVTRAEVADYVAAHRVEVGEVEHGIPQQPPLTADHLERINNWLGAHDFGILDEDQRHWLTQGGQPTYDELRNLNERVGLPLDDLPKVATTEGIVDQLKDLGYQVHEDDVTGQPYLMQKDATGTHIEVADGDAPADVRELLDQLRAGPLAPVKFPQYVAPGGRNYRELLLTMPPSRSLADTLAGRKAVFEKWAPRIAEVDQRLDDHLYGRGAAAGVPLADLQAERDRLVGLRDNEAADLAGEVPDGAMFRNSHWDEPNVLAHVRFDERTGPQGERVLHIAEVQSDWHQKGRRSGYRGGPEDVEQQAKLKALGDERSAARSAVIDTMVEHGSREEDAVAMLHNDIGDPHWLTRRQYMPAPIVAAMVRYHDTNNGMFAAQQGMTSQVDRVPNAPFKTTWPELAMKRMLRYAAEHGFDALSWDTGETSVERYDLSRHIDSVTAVKRVLSSGDGDYHIKVVGKDGATMHNGSMGANGLVNYIGKELAQKIVDQPPGLPAIKYEGLDLKVGGEGMKAFYDKILPAAVGKLVKKWGGGVESGTIPSHEYGFTVVDENRPGFPGPFMVIAHDGTPISGSFERREAEAYAAARSAEEEKTSLPAHVVRITPAMRDSVMAGQPMFLKRRKGSTGTEPPAPKRGAYALARRAIAAIPNNEFALSLRRIADPAGVSPPARATALVTREALGELAHASEEALRNLERYAKAFDLLSRDDRYAFIDAMEGGLAQKNADLQPAADAIRKLLDDWRERIRGLGTGALDNFIENYFPHIWQRDDKAKKVFGQIFGRRPLKGPASFLKERTIPTTREGLDAGLEPISSNPLILAFAKLREMQRFYTGVKLMQRFKDEGLAKFLPSGKPRPDDWAEINDAVGRVRQWSEVEQGFVERGHYIMPADAARVINNHLSSSALRNFLPAQVFRVMSNAVNALQLGFSAFHLGFTTLDAVISKNALAIERLAHGEPLRAAAALVEAATGIGGAVTNVVRGRRLLKAYAATGAVNPALARIVAGLAAAGGRVKMDNYYQAAQGLSPFKGVGFATLASDVRAALTQPSGKVWAATKVLGSFPIEYATRLWRDLEEIWRVEPLKILPIMSAMEIAGRMTRASTSIIMEHIVPLQKLGVFSDLAADHLRRNPLEDPVAFAAAMQKIWNSVDNRLGEMVYDNVFWNRTFKEVNHMMVRAVGWNLGTIRELGGAPVDVVKLLDYMARGAPAEAESPDLGKGAAARLAYEQQKSTLQRVAEKVGHKIPYTLALIGSTMILGAVLTYLFTGKAPEETKDYFFPWTGRRTKYGTKERISMPSYTKDLVEYGTQPMTTVINKANPIFGIAHAIYANEDFFGNAVRDPDASVWRQMWQGAQYAGRETQPFSLQGTKQYVGGGDMDTRGKILSTMPYVGFGPAPARVTSPEQMDRYQLRETEKSYIRGLQRRLKAATAKGDREEVDRIRSELRESKLRERGTEHDIREDQVKAREAADKISSLVEGRSRSDAVAALHAAGLPAFAELWRALPEHPRPRVAQSLDGFA